MPDEVIKSRTFDQSFIGEAGSLSHILPHGGTIIRAAATGDVYRAHGDSACAVISGDMRVLLARDDPRAREAIELFVYHAAFEAGALGGLDGLVFTAGIPPASASTRRRSVRRSAIVSFGRTLVSKARPMRAAPDVSVRWRAAPRSTSSPPDGEAMIARHTRATLQQVAA